jgi:hypothetical protein
MRKEKNAQIWSPCYSDRVFLHSCFLQSAFFGINALSMDIKLQHHKVLVVFKNLTSVDQVKNKILGKTQKILFKTKINFECIAHGKIDWEL